MIKLEAWTHKPAYTLALKELIFKPTDRYMNTPDKSARLLTGPRNIYLYEVAQKGEENQRN